MAAQRRSGQSQRRRSQRYRWGEIGMRTRIGVGGGNEQE